MPPNGAVLKNLREVRTILDFLLYKEYLKECDGLTHRRGLTFEQWRKVYALPPTQQEVST